MITTMTPNPTDTSLVIAFARDVGLLYAALPLATLKVWVPPAGDFKYQFTAVDGREWKQKIVVSGGIVTMNFDVSSMFLVSEFSAGRAVRDTICLLLLSGVTFIEVTF